MSPHAFGRTVTLLASALQNALNALPDDQRVELIKTISDAITQKKSVKEELNAQLSTLDNPLSHLKAPPHGRD